MNAPATTRKQFGLCIAPLAAAFSCKMTEEQVAAYHIALGDLPLEVLQVCVQRAMQQLDGYLPKPAAIRAFAAEATSGLLPQAGQEWDLVLKAVNKFGYPEKIKGMQSLSPLARQAVEAIGGWYAIGDMTAENKSTMNAQFRGAYEAAARREAEMRRISPELRPTITAGPICTPQLTEEKPNDVRRIVQGFADGIKGVE